MLESLSFALYVTYVKRQTPGNEKFYGIRQYRVNELAVLKLKYSTILRRKKENMKRKRSTKILPRNFEPAVCRSRKREA